MGKEYKGYDGTVVLSDNSITIKRGAKGFLLAGGKLRGDKTITISRIVAVQLKKAGMIAGYIQFTLMGGSEAKSGLIQSTTDENSIHFHNRNKNNEKFAELKMLIEQRMDGNNQTNQTSSANDLEKLFELKEKGVLTEEEFQKQKTKILKK